VTAPGLVRTISQLYDLFSDYNPYQARATDVRDLVATVGTRTRLDTTVADNGRNLDHAFGFVRCDASGGAYTLNLPDAPSMQGLHIWFKKVDASANAVTLAGVNGQTVDGAANMNLAAVQFGVLRLYSDGQNWEVV